MIPHPDHLEASGLSEELGPGAAVWRYPEMCEHWNVSRATVERWVRRYEQDGDGIPVHRDPSGRPYWLPKEASATARTFDQRAPARDRGDDRLEGLRRASRRRHRVA